MESVITATKLLSVGDMVRPHDTGRFFQIVRQINPGVVTLTDGTQLPSSTVWEKIITL
jgi:hypothetical protein